MVKPDFTDLVFEIAEEGDECLNDAEKELEEVRKTDPKFAELMSDVLKAVRPLVAYCRKVTESRD